MNKLVIKTDQIQLLINDGPELLTFSPSDITFAEKFYRLVKHFEGKQAEYQARAKELDMAGMDEATGLPINMEGGLAFLREVCEFMRHEIDLLFGDGTSDKVFGQVNTLDMFEQFFSGILPYVERARQEKVSKYTPKASSKGTRTLK